MSTIFLKQGSGPKPETVQCASPGPATPWESQSQAITNGGTGRPPSGRSVTPGSIGQIHQASRGTYGQPRVHAELVLGHGITVGHNTVGLLMRRAALTGLPVRRKAKRVPAAVTVTDLVKRKFTREAPNQQ